ncbi:probable galacturonosyltransferase 6 isoform X4 [Benincasa hispida]|uniref:probable galacturonosyltransferase 6 isoform X4 n=1 Tax=Benincasa hispida TaxID=102211 RepID=UPI0018FFF533|nr:probable galacturonosyltransferase 6 isoform X4 [Benincasa hispida]XP_038900194.1 probable galacturonosyltransferase 6 isoform X4 [Benincasa hispida]
MFLTLWLVNLIFTAICMKEAGESLKEPKPIVFEDKNFQSREGINSLEFGMFVCVCVFVSYFSPVVLTSLIYFALFGDFSIWTSGSKPSNEQKDKRFEDGGEKKHSSKETGRHDSNLHAQSRGVRDVEIEIKYPQHNRSATKRDKNAHIAQSRSVDYKVKEIKDQLIRAKAYLSFAPPGSTAHLMKELRQRVKELEHAVEEVTEDSALPKSALQKMKNMESSLVKAGHAFPDCSAMSSKLRAMTENAEEQVRMQKKQTTYLLNLAARTTPKGFHCLSMRLTSEYFALQPPEKQLLEQQKLHDSKLYHYAVFSDNVLASAVVVNSTISSAKEPEKIVFHLVTNSLNLPAMSMWFSLNPPGKATIEVLSMEHFKWLSTEYDLGWKMQNSSDPRFTSELNYLRFYLPNIFPSLDKIILLDHDVVVQKDLSGLWHLDMKGKVNAAVETCLDSEVSFLRMDMFINFSDPLITEKFDHKACTWAFGMNLFDLRRWREKNITALYHNYLRLSKERPMLKGGSLPLGWVTFYNQTTAVERRWHVLGLGHDSTVPLDVIEKAAVIHYDGVRKPWLDIGFGEYKELWSKHMDFNDPYLQQCNIHG